MVSIRRSTRHTTNKQQPVKSKIPKDDNDDSDSHSHSPQKGLPIIVSSSHETFTFGGVTYKSYGDMVMAKRKRNEEMLVQSGLLEASAQMKRHTTTTRTATDKSQPSHRGLRADRNKRGRNDASSSMPEPPRRKSSRIAGVKSDGMYIEEERAGGKFVIGGGGGGTSATATATGEEIVSNDKVLLKKETKEFFNRRVNDGSDLSIKDAVELADFKYVKEDSVVAVQKFLDDMSMNMDINIKQSSGGESPKSTVNVNTLMSQIDNLNVDDPECVAKVVPDRIYSVAFHPSSHKILAVAGDKQGHVGFWDVDGDTDADANVNVDADASRNNSKSKDGIVHLFKPHSGPVSNLEWTPTGDKLFSASYDGTVRLFDINQQTFVEAFATYDDSDEFKGKLGYGIDEGRKFWTQYMCLDQRNGNINGNGLFVTTSLGGLIHVDLRGKNKITFDLTLSDKKINTVSLHPNENIVATAGLDCEVNLWDIRKFSTSSSKKKLSPIATQRSSKSINSAFFSPSGKHLLTTTMADTLDIIADGHLQSGLIKKPTHRIRHDNRTGRWLSTFMAQWHPNPTVSASNSTTCEELFVVGSLAKPRRMEFFDAHSGNLLRGVSGDSLTAVVSRCCFHPSANRLVAMGGNSSGRVTIFR